MGEHEKAQGEEEAARRAREDMRAATDRLRARIDALRQLRREDEARASAMAGAPERRSSAERAGATAPSGDAVTRARARPPD